MDKTESDEMCDKPDSPDWATKDAPDGQSMVLAFQVQELLRQRKAAEEQEAPQAPEGAE